MPLTKMQREYLANCNHRWNIKIGATGSGKSYLDIAVTIPKRLLASRGEGLLVLMGSTRGTLERNILDPMREMWGHNVDARIGGDNTLRMFGHKVYVLGADNKKHVARIQGATIEYAYGDEIPTWSQNVFEMLKSRLRCEHSHFDGTGNPDNPQHWFKAFLESDADIYQQSYTIDDNPELPERFVAELKREYAGTVYYDRYILGKWVAASGVIYRPFTDNPEACTIDAEWIKAHPIRQATIGVDFGGNGSANAFACTGYTAGLRELVTLAEYYRKGTISPKQLDADFVAFARDCMMRFGARIAYCDSAEQTLMAGLRVACLSAGVSVAVENARKGVVNDRIRFLCRMMAAGRYRILRDCTNTAGALSAAVWDGKHPTEDVRLDDGTTNIDSLDALEYSFEPFMDAMLYGGLT